MVWTRYIETHDASVYRKYKSVLNAVRNATRKLQKDEQKKVTRQCKTRQDRTARAANFRRDLEAT